MFAGTTKLLTSLKPTKFLTPLTLNPTPEKAEAWAVVVEVPERRHMGPLPPANPDHIRGFGLGLYKR